MNKYVLMVSVAIITFGATSESWATWSNNCPNDNSLECKQCGSNCAYTQNDSGVVTLYGSGTIADIYTRDINGKKYDESGNLHPFNKNTTISEVQFAANSNFSSVGQGAFHGATGLTSITIPKSVTDIRSEAFRNTGLTSINLPDSITSIGGYAFYGATGLTSINLPDSITSIGDDAFHGATGLTSITIPEGVTSIGFHAFFDTPSLTNIIIPDSVTYIDMAAFSDSGITSITIPEGITYIEEATFADTSNLTSIVLPDSVTGIWMMAFYDSGITSITIPDSVTSIDGDAFDETDLTSILCKGTQETCETMKNALPSHLRDKVIYPTDKNSCESSSIGMYVWENNKCNRRNEKQCNSVEKYYYADGQCQVLPKTQSACTGTNIMWTTDSKCVNKNYIPPFSEADCYANGQVPYKDQCWDEFPFAKKKWTPAEAVKWLKEDDNTVTITFKK